MSLHQLMKIIQYRWICFLLTFVVVLAACLSALPHLQGSGKDEPNKVDIIIVYRNSESDNNYSLEYFNFIAMNQLDITEAAFLSELQVTYALAVKGSTIQVTLSASDVKRVSDAADRMSEIILKALDDEQSGWRYVKTVAKQQSVSTTLRNSLLKTAFNFLISFTLAIIGALVAVLVIDNLDERVRSIYHLNKTLNIPVLPVLSPKNKESELLALYCALPKGKPVVISGTTENESPSKMAVNLAEVVSQEEFSVAVVDFCGVAESNNPHVEIIPIKGASAKECMSDAFAKRLADLQQRYGMVFLAAPPVEASGISVALSEKAATVLLVRWGKDSEERVRFAAKCFSNEALAGVVITDYRPSFEYIQEGN